MGYDIFINIVATLLCGIAAAIAKRFWQWLKSFSATNLPEPRRAAPKKTLKKQFFYSLFLLAISLLLGGLLPFENNSWVGTFKIVCLLTSGFAFLTTWGAFEVAFGFYPSDEIISEPSDQPTDNTSK